MAFWKVESILIVDWYIKVKKKNEITQLLLKVFYLDEKWKFYKPKKLHNS
jgi:hypothetical protein